MESGEVPGILIPIQSGVWATLQFSDPQHVHLLYDSVTALSEFIKEKRRRGLNFNIAPDGCLRGIALPRSLDISAVKRAAETVKRYLEQPLCLACNCVHEPQFPAWDRDMLQTESDTDTETDEELQPLEDFRSDSEDECAGGGEHSH